MSKKATLAIVLVLACVVIAVVPLLTIKDSEFGGADGEAENIIEQVDPAYEPWAENIIKLPGGETESLLFCLQAAIGGFILGGGFGYFIARSKFSKENV